MATKKEEIIKLINKSNLRNEEKEFLKQEINKKNINWVTILRWIGIAGNLFDDFDIDLDG